MSKNLVSRSIGAGLLCALLLVDLGYVHGKAVRHDDTTYQKIAGMKRDLNVSLARDEGLCRVGAFEHPLGANLEMFLGYQTVGGFTALFPSRYYEYIDKYADYQLPRGWVSFFYGLSKNHVLMDLLNVKYEILYTSKVIGFRQTYLPRAFIIPNCTIVEKPEVLDILTSPQFDPYETVIFEKEDGSKCLEAATRKPSLSDQVKIKAYSSDSLMLNTFSQNPGYLFLSEIHYPGWKAFIDEQPAEILRGNYLFRVLDLPPGHHQVRLLFDPFTIKLGIGITVLSLFITLTAIAHSFGRRTPLFKRAS